MYISSLTPYLGINCEKRKSRQGTEQSRGLACIQSIAENLIKECWSQLMRQMYHNGLLLERSVEKEKYADVLVLGIGDLYMPTHQCSADLQDNFIVTALSRNL